METTMLREIREQPDLLQRVGEQVRAFQNQHSLKTGRFRALHLVGCGDMDFSARTAAGSAGPEGARVQAHRAMDMRWQAAHLCKDDLVIAASFSGRTPRTLESALLASKQGARVWGITGNAGSPLTQVVEEVLVLNTGPAEELVRHAYAGYHHNVPQTKTFTAVLRAFFDLLRGAGCLPQSLGIQLDSLAGDMARFLPDLEERVDRFMAASFRPVDRIAVLGSGPWRALSAYGAAKFLEMAVPARCQCIEENNHLEMFVTQADDFLIFLAPDGDSFSRAREMFGPYDRFGSLSLVLAPSTVTGYQEAFKPDVDGAAMITLPDGGRITLIFAAAFVLQLLAERIGLHLGRDINHWVGGVRTPLIESLGQVLVRDSKIRT
jgi:fructoselysine-6-P-deglycase FrlB-like protein